MTFASYLANGLRGGLAAFLDQWRLFELFFFSFWQYTAAVLAGFTAYGFYEPTWFSETERTRVHHSFFA